MNRSKKLGTNLITRYKENDVSYRGMILPKMKGNKPPKEGTTIVPQWMVNTYNPDEMDAKHFWSLATKESIGHSIISRADISDRDEINTRSFHDLHLKLGLVHTLFNVVKIIKGRVNFLEIGPGLGNIKILVKERFPQLKWHGLDVNCLFKHPNLYRGDGRTIPDKIPELGIVYSINVFQHLSVAQRVSYYNDIYDKLNPDGVFLFGMFVVNETNENEMTPEGKRLFGVKDENGNYLTHFFSQFTEIEWYGDIIETLEEIGFIVVDTKYNNNYCTFLCGKY
tara:strand:+ start:2138 stop:2980 length:843 start_codon:yes stop_codon:yes gene_type:complete